jgi:hypothetical protein
MDCEYDNEGEQSESMKSSCFNTSLGLCAAWGGRAYARLNSGLPVAAGRS